jgi:hypothetical protein
VHRNAAELAVDLLALAGVHPGAHVHAESLNLRDDRGGTRKRSSRFHEGREVPVAGGVFLVAAVALELLTDDSAESREQLTPAGVAQLGCEGSRPDDVEKKNGRQPAPYGATWHASIIRRSARGG